MRFFRTENNIYAGEETPVQRYSSIPPPWDHKKRLKTHQRYCWPTVYLILPNLDFLTTEP